MSNIALKAGSGGTGTVSLESPGVSVDYTSTLPAGNTVLAGLDIEQTFQKPQRCSIVVDNDGSFSLASINNFKCTPAADFTLTFTNIPAGVSQAGYILLINSGGYTVSAASTTKINSSVLSNLKIAGTYLLSYFSDGTDVYVSATGNILS